MKRVPAYARASAGVALLVLEVIGCLAMWAPIPLAWMWVGARVYEVTGSLSADLAVAFGGFFATTLLTMGALDRIDMAWVELRRRSGYDQREGALTQIVVVSATIAMVVFWVWFHILERRRCSCSWRGRVLHRPLARSWPADTDRPDLPP